METEDRKGTLLLIGDWNGRVGNKPQDSKCRFGKYGKKEENNNGKQIIDLLLILK